jgi:ribosomal protection tetracycline resistance protein
MLAPGWQTSHPSVLADREFVPDLATDLAEHQEALLAAIGDGQNLAYEPIWCELARQTRACLVQPLLFGSGLTGAGISQLKRAIVDLLPARSGDRDGPLSGTVFKVERSAKGENWPTSAVSPAR